MKDCAGAESPNHNNDNIKLSGRVMPTVSISLSEIGYEGYMSISKGMRSKCIDKLLREYALKSNWTVRNGEHMTVKQVFERQKYLEMTLASYAEKITDLKKELKE